MVKKTMRITIDLRMMDFSGIGIYLRNVVPRLIQLRGNDFFYLLTQGGEGDLGDWARADSIQRIEIHSPIYSLGQQWELLRKIPGDSDLFWSPHFDIPILVKG